MHVQKENIGLIWFVYLAIFAVIYGIGQYFHVQAPYPHVSPEKRSP